MAVIVFVYFCRGLGCSGPCSLGRWLGLHLSLLLGLRLGLRLCLCLRLGLCLSLGGLHSEVKQVVA